MKTLVFFLLFHFVSFSQQYVERYNSITKRYEVLDSRGQLKGYKIYNGLKNQWEYYDVNSQSGARKYSDPLPTYNFDLLYRALEYRQTQHDNNVDKVQNYINQLASYIQSLDVSTEVKNNIYKDFQAMIGRLNAGNYDYGNSQTVNSILTRMQNTIVKIIEDNVKESNTVLAFMGNVGGYRVSTIQKSIYKDGKWSTVETNTNSGLMIYYDNNRIFFNNGTGWNERWLTFEKYNETYKLYEYSSPQGRVAISHDFRYIIFDNGSIYGDTYTYHISGRTNIGKPY